jgi:superoxide dismutase, Fe-Mn family
MAIEFLPLPFSGRALEPWMSYETLDYHHGKHHKRFVEITNVLINGTEFESLDLPDLIQATADQEEHRLIFENAVQVWNHNFFWQCLKGPHDGHGPDQDFLDMTTKRFGSFDHLKEEFNSRAENIVGSGWVWLTFDKDKGMEITETRDSSTPLLGGGQPILTCDMWEHAYYIDYRNNRPEFLKNFWNLINWDFVHHQLTEQSPRHPSKPARHVAGFDTSTYH